MSSVPAGVAHRAQLPLSCAARFNEDVPALPTGLVTQDAQDDFQRARRRQIMARMARVLTGQGDVDVILPFDEVVQALGQIGERDLGFQVIPLHSIVGTVDRRSGFDREFRPTTPRVRTRWERIAAAMRRGETLPPIDVYRIGEVHFVKDGHHRVSVARALGHHDIEAHVTEVLTRVGADRTLRLHDLPVKSNERLFHERVPLPPAARARIRLSDADDYAKLAEGVEAWGFRVMQEIGELLDRVKVARRWYVDEYEPVVAMLRDAGMLGKGTETEAYIHVATERYRLLRTHEWSQEVLSRLRSVQKP
jgi:hypothetical protein